MSKKTLLQENTIRRFWKLASIKPLSESDIDYLQEEEELEEGCVGVDEELEEVHAPALRDEEELEEAAPSLESPAFEEELEDDLEEDPAPAMDEPPMDAEPEMDLGDEPEGDVEATVPVSEEDVPSLETAVRILQDILSAAATDEEPAPEGDLAPEEEPLPPEPEEELMEVETEIDEQRLEEVISDITDRVTKRILKEALAKKISKK